MNEVMARSLSPKELAEEFRYHDDPGVAKLACAVIQATDNSDEAQEAIRELENRASGAEADVSTLADLLKECQDELPDHCKDLHARIADAVASVT